jgi:hypothetical protein
MTSNVRASLLSLSLLLALNPYNCSKHPESNLGFPAWQQDQAISQTEPADKIIRSDGSIIIGNVYRNLYFGFSIELPKGWTIAPEKDVEVQQKAAEDKLAETDPKLKEDVVRSRMLSAPTLVVVENTSGKEGFDRRGVEILASDVSGEHEPFSGEAFFKAAAEVMRERKLPVEYLGNVEKIMIAGETLWKARLKETTSGHVQFVREYLAFRKKCAVQFLLIGPDDAGLEDLEPVIHSLHFFSSIN